MRLAFLYGTAASGKLTVARALAALTGDALFHNHLVVDAVAAVFPFGTPEFVRLREAWWLEMIGAAARAGRSTIFTFMPEPSVAPDFAERVRAVVEGGGGTVRLVRLTLDRATQEARIDMASRAAFGKLRALDMVRAHRDAWAEAEAAMPPPALTIDTGLVDPEEAARRIAALA